MSKSKEVHYKEALKSLTDDFERITGEFYIQQETVDVIQIVLDTYPSSAIAMNVCFSLGVVAGNGYDCC